MLFSTKSKRRTASSPATVAAAKDSTQDDSGSRRPSRVESLLEYATSAGLSPKIDTARGVLHGVKVLGLTSRNGRHYREAAIAAAAPLYEGIKVNVNHARGPHKAPRDYQDRLGCLRDVTASGDGLFADLHFNPRHALAEQLIWDAKHAPENVGLSHNVEARTSRSASEVIVEEILRVNCVDLVADPASTAGLFESLDSASREDMDLRRMEFLIEELRDRRPELFTLTQSAPTAFSSRGVELSSDVVTPEFAQLLEELDPELAEALRRERLAWGKQVRGSGKPKCKGPMSVTQHETTDARNWVRRIT